MSIQWMDNFGSYGTDTTFLLDGLYAENNGCTLVADPDPNDTGTVLCLPVVGGGGGNYCRLRKVLDSAQVTSGAALRWYMSAIPNEDDKRPWPIMWRDGSNNEIARIQVTPTGAIAFYNNGTLVATTSGPVVTARGWWHIEAELVCSLATSGTFELRVEGVQVLTATGLTTIAANTSQISIANDPDNTSSGVICYAKDLVIWDGAGSVNNDFIGSVSVYRLAVNEDVSSGWVPSSGSSDYELLDESPPADTGYISADDAPPAPSIMGLEDLPPDVVSVRAIMSLVRQRKTDGGDADVQVSLSPNGTDWDAGADNPITTAFTYWYDVSEVSPDTAAAWTPTEVNDATIRINRTL